MKVFNFIFSQKLLSTFQGLFNGENDIRMRKVGRENLYHLYTFGGLIQRS
jgi:hypothetical protein